MNILLTKCDNIRCFSETHKFCPVCFDVFHLICEESTIEDYKNLEVTITKCDRFLCFSPEHTSCPSCNRSIHVKI